MFLRHFSLFRGTISNVLLEIRHGEKINLWKWQILHVHFPVKMLYGLKML